MPKTEIHNVNDIIEWGKQNDPRVIGDNEYRAKVIEAGKDPCKRCGGTGNQLYFMYQQCTDCKGVGYTVVPGTLS